MARKQTMRRQLGFTAAAWLVGFLIFFPILWMFLTSFKTEGDAYAIPPKFLFFHWTTENYAEVQSRADYVLHAYNSIVLSVGANLAGLVLAIPITAGLKAVCDNVAGLRNYGRLLGD